MGDSDIIRQVQHDQLKAIVAQFSLKQKLSLTVNDNVFGITKTALNLAIHQKARRISNTTADIASSNDVSRVTVQGTLPNTDNTVYVFILCEGTGHDLTSTNYTNITNMYSLFTDPQNADKLPKTTEIIYAKGFGTSGSIFDTADQITAYTVKQRLATLLDTIDEVMKEYQNAQPQKEITLLMYGFSRGSFLARALLGMDGFTHKITFLGLFDTVPGVVFPDGIDAFKIHIEQHGDKVDEYYHIMAETAIYLYENVSYYCRLQQDGGYCMSLQDNTCELRAKGDHCNIGGGWNAHPKTEPCLANNTLQQMLAASSYTRALATVVGKEGCYPLFKQTGKDNGVRSMLSYKDMGKDVASCTVYRTAEFFHKKDKHPMNTCTCPNPPPPFPPIPLTSLTMALVAPKTRQSARIAATTLKKSTTQKQVDIPSDEFANVGRYIAYLGARDELGFQDIAAPTGLSEAKKQEIENFCRNLSHNVSSNDEDHHNDGMTDRPSSSSSSSSSAAVVTRNSNSDGKKNNKRTLQQDEQPVLKNKKSKKNVPVLRR